MDDMAAPLLLAFALTAGAATPAWRDPALPPAARARDLTGRLTAAEKIAQLNTDAPAIPRLGLRAFTWAGECVHGLVAERATIFPQAIAMAATFDPDLVGRVAGVIAIEARALHARGRSGLVFFSPVLNLARDPRWGRVQESYGEDPLLAARLGVAFIRGLQGPDPLTLRTAAVAKHFAVYSEETRRHTASATVSDALLRDVYLPQFAAAVREAGAAGIMCAYNAVNGVPCCASPALLAGTLRDTWGFPGFVVSDCGAITDIHAGHRYRDGPVTAAAAALRAGCDLACGGEFGLHLPDAVRSGLVTDADLDRAVARLMEVRVRLGEFDPPAPAPPLTVVDSPAHRALAREVAARSLVLLSNPGGLLPWRPADLPSLAVIGPSAAVRRLGNYSGWFTPVVTPLDGFRAALPRTVIRYAKGCEIIRRTPLPAAAFTLTPGGAPGLRAEYFANPDFTGRPVLTRTVAGPALAGPADLPAPLRRARACAIRWTGWLVPAETRATRLALTVAGAARLRLDGDLLVDQWFERPATTDSVTVALRRGEPRRLVVEAAMLPAAAAVELGSDQEPDRRLLEEAVAAARSSAACVIVVGTDRYTENEGMDRPDLELPGDQPALIRAVLEANPRTVVVIETGGPVNLDWSRSATPAVLAAWFPGEEGGAAIADAVLGRTEPGGRLPLTWHESAATLPPLDDYALGGGRTYRYARAGIRYPFGHGLGYASFRLDTPRLAADAGGGIVATVDVTNTGARRGDAVPQAYLRAAAGADPAPRLAAFTRVTLEPGERRAVALAIGAGALSGATGWTVAVGESSAAGLTASWPPPR